MFVIFVYNLTMSKLEIKNLHAMVENKEILKGINVTFETGKVYAIIGPNGNGKSTLLSSIMGDPNYKITKGEIILDGKDIRTLEVDERAKLGIFLGMQYPPEIEGVSNIDVIKSGIEKRENKIVSPLAVYGDALDISAKLRIDEEMLERDVNVGFSGGEKKKNELLHMFMLKPKFAFLDEVDSGLDVDSIAAISKMIRDSKNSDKAVILVSHYKTIYEIIKPDVAIIIKNGQIFKIGDYNLLINTLEKGFDED